MTTTKKTPASGEPEFRLVEGSLHVITTTQGELVLPLTVKTKVFRQLSEIDDELKQLFAMLDALGDTDTPAKLDELDFFETNQIAARFFDEFAKKAQASLGESQRSSD
ncbi:hypothetical protein [Curtobacterium flaccumfaciens]|uniref:hypothetical protein n=1 Tax=Curtobacterium flaccumfaciens TaxID=2035 RepID=UPI00188D8269|nr:hypothetical protein [Curtobacterium flaccumfaciens]MBF4628892.1 hypothetical protein [Curtobacterium flaccumfaciens]